MSNSPPSMGCDPLPQILGQYVVIWPGSLPLGHFWCFRHSLDGRREEDERK